MLPTLSVVIPAYNEGAMVGQTAIRIENVMQGIGCSYQIIFVDDGSHDDTWAQIMLLAQSSPYVVGIKLSKNFGKESAMLAGLSKAEGDAVAIIDCDLQHPPDTISEMYQTWVDGGVDVVEGFKESRGNEPRIYKLFARIFYSIVNRLGNIDLQNLSDFQLLDRRVVDVIVSLPERQRFFRALSSWTGFSRRKVSFRVLERQSGSTKWNFWKLFKYAVTNITSFSSFPLQIVTFSGFLFFTVAVIFGIRTLYAYIAHRAVEGFTTVILLLLIIGSMLMISLGILGLYIAKIYEEIKGRPPYLIEAVINHTDDGQEART